MQGVGDAVRGGAVRSDQGGVPPRRQPQMPHAGAVSSAAKEVTLAGGGVICETVVMNKGRAATSYSYTYMQASPGCSPWSGIGLMGGGGFRAHQDHCDVHFNACQT